MKYLLIIILSVVSNQHQLRTKFNSELIKKSIDFITYYYSYDKSNDLFLELDITEYSEQNCFFKYDLKERFYYEDIETLKEGKFYRSNDVIIAVKQNDTCYYSIKLHNISDSITSFYKNDNLHYLANPYPASAVWSRIFVTYKDGYLSGNINLKTDLMFNRFDVNNF